MAEEALVESRLDESVELISTLDAQGDRPTTALWYYYPDADVWRMLVAGPTFDSLLPKEEFKAYRKVASAFGNRTLRSLSIADVKLIRTDDPLPEAARRIVRTPEADTVRVHLRDNTVNGLFIKEMVVLRAA